MSGDEIRQAPDVFPMSLSEWSKLQRNAEDNGRTLTQRFLLRNYFTDRPAS